MNTFSIAQKEFLPLLSAAQPICNRRTTLAVTEFVFFHVTPNELTLKTTDLEISLQYNIPIKSELAENATFLISGKRIFDIIKEIDSTITITLDESQAIIKADGIYLALNIKNAEEFPPLPERIENFMEIDASFFLKLLTKVAFVIPQNSTNPALNGMLLEFSDKKMNLVATDGHCLAQVETDKYSLNEEKKWLIPKRAVFELKKLLENYEGKQLFLGVCDGKLVFSGENFNFFTRLIADAFPVYKPILDKKGFLPAQLARDSFVKTLKRASCLLAGQFISTNFSFTPKTVNVSIRNNDVGQLEESVAMKSFKGGTVQSNFYSPYLLSGLQVFDKEDVSFFIKSDTRPIIFESEEESYCFSYLVMPVSISQENK